MKRYIKAKTVSLLDESSATLEALAKDFNTDSDVLADLANCTDSSILYALAQNPNTPHNILRKLLSDYPSLDLPLACNINLPSDLCEELVNPIHHIIVRIELADNPCLPVSVMEKFSNDADTDIRQALTYNRSLPKRLIAKLANDDDPQVRKHIALNPNISIKLLRKLAKDDKWYVREIAESELAERQGQS